MQSENLRSSLHRWPRGFPALTSTTFCTSPPSFQSSRIASTPHETRTPKYEDRKSVARTAVQPIFRLSIPPTQWKAIGQQTERRKCGGQSASALSATTCWPTTLSRVCEKLTAGTSQILGRKLPFPALHWTCLFFYLRSISLLSLSFVTLPLVSPTTATGIQVSPPWRTH
jgi:hypothetical protein